MVVSSNAGCPFADVARDRGPWWLQVYLTADRADTVPVLRAAVGRRGSRASCSPPTPRSSARDARGRRPAVWDGVDPTWLRGNFAGHVRDSPDAAKAMDLGPHDIAWLARRPGSRSWSRGSCAPTTPGAASTAGAAAVWVSNHGGRQLDQAVATADCAAAVAGEVGGRGRGVRRRGSPLRASTCCTALALGRRRCLPRPARCSTPSRPAEPDGVGARCSTSWAPSCVEALRLAGCRDAAARRGTCCPPYQDSPARNGTLTCVNPV